MHHRQSEKTWYCVVEAYSRCIGRDEVVEWTLGGHTAQNQVPMDGIFTIPTWLAGEIQNMS
jgi:hypothetical protein